MTLLPPSGETQLLQLETTSSSDSLMNSFGIEDESTKFLLSDTSPKRRRSYNRWCPIEEGVTLTWRDLSIYIHTKKKGSAGYKRIINNVTGAVKAGSLVALMGSSGAGKSTLMSALAYRNSGMVVEGDILINGRQIGNFMRYLSGYMHQEDLFIGALTVWEHMNIMARIKLDRRVAPCERKYKIHELLKLLGLTKCLNTRVGLVGDGKVLSGGEKKRLTFATELLTDPPVLFCDEPTTGLDSYSAQKIVTMMNLMAAGGKTILCTIHQPSSEIFAMFTQIILLADGRIAYMGSTANAIRFFDKLGYSCPNNYNPADFFIRTLATTLGAEDSCKQTVKKICDHFAVSEFVKEVDVVVQYEFHMGRASGALAVIIGLCYTGTITKTQNGIQSVEGVLFMFVTENTFNPMYSVLATFPSDRLLFIREYKSGLYSAGIYYVAKIVAMLPGLIIEPVLFIIIAYWLAGLKSTMYAFWLTTATAVLTLNVAAACGIFFSNAFGSIPNAMAYLVPFDYVLMVTSGLFIKLSSLSTAVAWTKYLSWIMYSTEILTIIQWEDVHNITCEHSNPSLPCLTEGSEVLEKYSFSGDHLYRDISNMFFLCVIFHVLAFTCLWRRTKK